MELESVLELELELATVWVFEMVTKLESVLELELDLESLLGKVLV